MLEFEFVDILALCFIRTKTVLNWHEIFSCDTIFACLWQILFHMICCHFWHAVKLNIFYLGFLHLSPYLKLDGIKWNYNLILLYYISVFCYQGYTISYNFFSSFLSTFISRKCGIELSILKCLTEFDCKTSWTWTLVNSLKYCHYNYFIFFY